MITFPDEQLQQVAADLAAKRSQGFPVQESVVRLVAAIIATRAEIRRREMASAAEALVEQMGTALSTVGLQFLRATLFGLAAA